MTIRDVSTAACWLAILASFVLSFSTWLALGQLAGFGVLAVALPFCVDGYVVTALTTWLTPGLSEKLARFARANLYAVGLGSVLAQASYHAASVLGQGQWKLPLAFAVGGFPPAIATLAVHIRARAVRELAQLSEPASQPAPATASTADPLDRVPEPALSAPPLARPPATTVPTASAQPVTAAVSASPEPAPARVVAPPRPRPAPPRPLEESSGSGPRTNVPTVDDVRPLIAAGLGRNQIAQRLGIGTGTARALIAQARTEGSRLAAVS